MQQSLQTSLTSIQALADEPAKASEAPSIFCSMLDGLNSLFDTDLFGLFSLDAFTQTVDNLDLDKYSGRWYQVCGFLPSCRLGGIRDTMLYCCCWSIQSEYCPIFLYWIVFAVLPFRFVPHTVCIADFRSFNRTCIAGPLHAPSQVYAGEFVLASTENSMKCITADYTKVDAESLAIEDNWTVGADNQAGSGMSPGAQHRGPCMSLQL
jgi:hypothetical protein